MIFGGHFVNSSILKATYAYRVAIHLRKMEVEAIPCMGSSGYGGMDNGHKRFFQKRVYRSCLKAFKMKFYTILHRCGLFVKSVLIFVEKCRIAEMGKKWRFFLKNLACIDLP